MSDPTSKTTDPLGGTPFPPGRICPECGQHVGWHDGMLYCKRECSQNELARYDLEHEADEADEC